MIYINLLILTLIVVFVVDISGFFPTIGRHLYRWIFDNKKEMPYDFDWDYVSILFHPLKCSLCSSFWIGIIYLLATASFTIINLGYVALLAFMTPVFHNALILIKDIIGTLLNLAFKYLTK